VAANTNGDLDSKLAVEEYVKKTKHWTAGSYRIELNRREKNFLVFWVVNKEDEKSIVPGGGKSFEVHVDSTNHHVLDEFHFQ